MAYFSSFIGRGFRLKYLACNKNYLDNSWLSSQTLPTSGAKTTYGYNTLRQKTDLLNASAAGVQISRFGDATDATAKLLYDGRGQLNRVRALLPDNLTNQTNYSYDAKGQLSFSRRYTSATAYTERTYQYDGAGNPTSWNGQTRTFNILNQETTGGTSQFNYDGNGSATKYRGRTHAYDVENRLTQVNSESGALLLTSGYRWDGKRAWKENGNGFRTYTFYDGDQTLFDVSESNQVLALVAWGANGVLEWSQVDSTKQPLWDARGNMSQLLDATGNLITTFDTDAWGNITRSNTAAEGGYGAQWGYRTDVETGYILCTHRYYDPAGGRWLTRDPIEYSGGMNLYGYVTNNPVNLIDPSGLYVETLLDVAGAAYDLNEFRKSPSFWGGVSVVGSVAAVLVPVPGPGTVKIGVNATKAAARAAKIAKVQASIARRADDLAEYAKVCNKKHFDAVRRELWGEIVKQKSRGDSYNHIHEVRDAMNGLRTVIRHSKGALKDRSHSPAIRAAIKSQLRSAQKMLRDAENAFKSGP